MLQNIRDRASGPVAWFIVALISVPFALWGINSYFGGTAQADVAKVGDQTISQRQFQTAYEQRFRQLQTMLGDQFDPDKINPAQFRRGVLQGLIEQALLTQHAVNAGYRIGDDQVLDYLMTIPAFQDNGRFSSDTYRNILQRQGMTAQSFEASVRHSLLINQLQEGISASAFATPALATRMYALAHETRQFHYALFEASAYSDQVTLSDSDIQSYYDQHKKDYQTPARVQLSYIDLSLSDLEAGVKENEAALKQLYQSEKSQRFTTPGAREARHILIAVKNDDSAAAEKKIQEIRQKLEDGADFATMARKVSDDPGSADKGGELGWITRGMMPDSFEKALFSLQKPGQISEPVRTRFGWHLVQLEAERPAKVRPFDDPAVQKTLKTQYRQQQASQHFSDASDQLDKLTFENPDSLKPAADALGLDVKTSDWITQDDSKGIAQYADVVKAAFSDQVLNQHVNSRPIKVGPQHLIVIRANKYQARQQQSLDQVRDQVEKAARQARASELADKAASGVAKALRQGQTFEEAVKDEGGKVVVKTPDPVARDSKDVPAALLQAVFTLPRPQKDKPVVESLTLPKGSVAVVRLTAVNPGAMAKDSDKQMKQMQQQLDHQLAAEEFAAYQAWLSQRIKVQVYKKNELAGTGEQG